MWTELDNSEQSLAIKLEPAYRAVTSAAPLTSISDMWERMAFVNLESENGKFLDI